MKHGLKQDRSELADGDTDVLEAAREALYRLYLGIADGMPIARVWACWYSKRPPRRRAYRRRCRDRADIEPRYRASCAHEHAFRGTYRVSPTACPLRGSGRAGTQNDRLSEAVIWITGTSIAAQWACRWRCRDAAQVLGSRGQKSVRVYRHVHRHVHGHGYNISQHADRERRGQKPALNRHQTGSKSALNRL